MGIRQRFIETLAPKTNDDVDAELDDADPRGEDRSGNSSRRTSSGSGFIGYMLGLAGTRDDNDDELDVVERTPPSKIAEYWREYYQRFALTRAPLRLFDETVVEPGVKIRAEDAEGERDREMENALRYWADNCVIHAGELGHPIETLVGSIPSRRRGKGTVFVEKVGTKNDPDALVGLMSLDPSTFKIRTRENQPILLQPDDVVDDDAPLAPGDKTAAYLQYDDALGYDESDTIPFATGDVIKLTYDTDDGEVWGSSVFDACAPRIDSLRQKLDDRDYAIRMTAYGHRIYSSEGWSMAEAENYAEAHRDGDVSANYAPNDRDDDTPGGEKKSFAGRVDFVPHTVEVTAEHGDVPDLSDPIQDDIEQIFSVMPVSKFKIAYEEGINQFVVEPQSEKDSMLVDAERRYIERRLLQPVFDEKVDELASGDRYNGSVSVTIEPPETENPLRRESYPDENIDTFANAWQKYMSSNAEVHLPPEAFAELMGFDLGELQDKYDFDVDELSIPDENDTPSSMAGASSSSSDGGGEGDDDVDENEGE